ncbi:related to BSC1 Transcript encoded by this ORF shows a high level of stop codon bypass [Ramularia collo-cygni]|uniref:Related to BSC1 Transcript encoded by this ORF shows a high level of stop codon bypass n=1 Tax=Ramularia collo-cygni TaxID=112498 RepID=A0A2D3VC74_9PEZI|nr:related to BSC1 Transcript encoded by this ORF shows a high level of stop codon bypass [Ramularia collo-cygni]CZT20334.1 related to BSC1 Transcript encoded by this ORF shows a high level of stop codon bypass [Ramularia collo-cygni]
MLPGSLLLLCLAAIGARAQNDEGSSSSDSATSSSSSGSNTRSSTRSSSSSSVEPVLFTFTNGGSTLTGTQIPTAIPTGSDVTYLTGSSQSTRETSTRTSNDTMTTSSNSQITASSKAVSVTQIIGGAGSNSTMTSKTSSAAAPTNTVPCNGFPEFCERKYSNISMVVAHNAAFVQPANAASNQLLGVKDQLADGVRMIQGEVHWDEANQTLYNCHSNCDLLNTGPYQDTLTTIRKFLDDNPYDVVSILIVNSVYTKVENFVPAITNAGLLPYVYEPQYVPQHRDQWPTLGEMILRNQRAVIFMDYEANQESVPYILDEFSHIWETPFSPVDASFPCTQQRPPDLDPKRARDEYMYMANHNLNTAIDLSSLGIDTGGLLVPNTPKLNITNAKGNETGMLGAMSYNCAAEWGHPPNFLLVDYYNVGPSGDNSPDVFDVAAKDNGVVYSIECCGMGGQKSAAPVMRMSFAALVVAVGVFVVVV